MRGPPQKTLNQALKIKITTLKTPDFLPAVEVPLIQATILAILNYPTKSNTIKIIMYLATPTLITS